MISQTWAVEARRRQFGSRPCIRPYWWQRLAEQASKESLVRRGRQVNRERGRRYRELGMSAAELAWRIGLSGNDDCGIGRAGKTNCATLLAVLAGLGWRYEFTDRREPGPARP